MDFDRQDHRFKLRTTRKNPPAKEVVLPPSKSGPDVRMICPAGPTVYDRAHLGTPARLRV